jgi:hypothetical protein
VEAIAASRAARTAAKTQSSTRLPPPANGLVQITMNGKSLHAQKSDPRPPTAE